MGNLSKETFETEARNNFEELSSLVQEYEQGEQESELAEFAKYDPLKNIILGLAAKLRSKPEQDLSTNESLERADELTRKAEEEIKKPNVKKKICASLKSGSGDAVKLTPAILPLLIELIEGGVIAISFDPTGTVLVSVACLIIIKMGVEGFCAD